MDRAHAWDSRGARTESNHIEPLCPKVGGLAGEAIDCGPTRSVSLVTRAVAAATSRWLCRVADRAAACVRPDTPARVRGDLGKCHGMLGFGGLVLAPFGLPLRRLPTPHQPQAFGILAVTLIPTPRLVLASTAFAQADARPRSSATAVWLIMTTAHGSVFSPGTVRGERVNVLLGRLSKSRSQTILPRVN